MARRKTARQKRATRKKAYYKREFLKNVAALAAMEDLGVKAPNIKIPKNITKASLKRIRKEYTKAKKKAKDKNIKLPTKEELAKSVMEDPLQEYKYKRSGGFDPGMQYLESLISTLEMQMPQPRRKMSEDTYWKIYDESYAPAVERAKQKIEAAALKVGAYELSQALASNEYMQKVEQIPLYYIDEAAAYVDDVIGEQIEAAVNSELDSY